MSIHPFDLQARAELATHSLTALLDHDRDGLMYFLASWGSRPPRADHSLWDCGDGSGRHIDALALARTMLPATCQASRATEGEHKLEAWMMRLVGDDGLSWLINEPFANPWGTDMLCHGRHTDEDAAEISWAQRGSLLGLTTRWLATGEDIYHTTACRLIDRLLAIALHHGDGLYFPEGYYRRSGWHTDAVRLATGIEEYNAAVLWPATRFYAASGYAPALALAEGIARFALHRTRGYLPGGAIAPVESGLEDHFHTRSNFMLGVLKLGLVCGRPDYVAWARQTYDRACSLGTDFGWFPEGIQHRHGEICCTTDMLELALLLGRHVDPTYYADAERYGRNHLLEAQFLDLGPLQRATERLPVDTQPPPNDGKASTTRQVVASQVGGFASRPTLNDAFHTDALAMMQCCNAAGTRALYDLWRYASDSPPVDAGQRPLRRIHLRFSCATPELRVVSHEPARGQLEISSPTPCRIAVRLPAGEDHAFLCPGTEDPSRMLLAKDGYVHFDMSDGTAQLHYLLRERSAEYSVGAGNRTAACVGQWRGETLMRVDPPGPFLPLYRRTIDVPPVQPSAAGRLIDSL